MCCQTTQFQGSINALIAHLWYDNTSDTYTTMNNNSVTEIPALISLNEQHKHKSPVTLPIFLDSGASLCLAGLKLLLALGDTKENLISCNKIVATISWSKISCLGLLSITFKINNDTVYICDKVDKIYFSKQGCLATNILPALFPFLMSSKEQESVQSVTVDSSSVPNYQDISQIVNQNGYNTTCCSTHTFAQSTHTPQPPPKKHAHLPYPATNENVPKLKRYILDQFSSIAFNTSRPFPAMDTTPAHIHLKLNTTSYATHTPILIPYHWKQIKESLGADVQKGIIEPVPI